MSHRVIHSLEAIRRSAPDVPCELWISQRGLLPADLEAYVQTWKHLITVRKMPSSHTNNHNGRVIDLTGIHGGYIGKGLALRDSHFDFPIVLDGDSWPCPGWFDAMKEAVQHADVIWSLAPNAFGGTRGKPLTYSSPMIAGQEKEYSQFGERNTGTVFGVRRTTSTQLWLTDALDVRSDQIGKKRLYSPTNDQPAFRESFFLHRHKLKEHVLSKNLACRSRNPTGNRCACTCECSSCLFVHDFDGSDHKSKYTGFNACAMKYANATEGRPFSLRPAPLVRGAPFREEEKGLRATTTTQVGPKNLTAVKSIPLITGCGRSGTKSLQENLESMGLKAVHEKAVPGAISVSWLYGASLSQEKRVMFESRKSLNHRYPVKFF